MKMSEDHKNIKNVIDQIFAQSGKLSSSYNQHTIEEVWRSTFGDVISSYTTRVIYKNETLTVYINSSTLREEITINRDKIMKSLNEKLQYKKVTKLLVR